MKQVYLSPHLDDALLSCGGTIHRQTAAGQEVLVITLFSADARPDSPLSPFARQLHADWGHPPRPMALRRAEDLAALTLLRAEAQHLGYLDAIYRTAADGRWLYPDLQTLFGPPHPDDPLAPHDLADLLAGLVPRDSSIYAPLGVGRHVDHQLVHAAAWQLLARGRRLAFYEDFPYAEKPGALEAALAAVGQRVESWQAEEMPLAAADLSAKVAALGYYRSQMAILFDGAEAMPNRVWAFAARLGTGLTERIWWPQLPPGEGAIDLK